jgi:methyl-accepting chemotaxis protein
MLRVPIAAALGLILVLALVPAGVLGGLFLKETNKSITFAERERTGLAFLRTVWPVYTTAHVPDAQMATAAARLRAGHRRFASNVAVYADALNSGVSARTTQAAVVQAEIANDMRWLREPVADLVTRVGDQSNLILDPDLDTYYLMDVILLKLPELTEAMRVAENERAVGNDLAVAIATARVRDIARATTQSIDKAIADNVDQSLRQTEIVSLRNELAREINAYALALRGRGDADIGYGRVVLARDRLWSGSANQLDRLLHARIARMEGDERMSIALAGTITVIAFALAAMLIRSLTGALQTIRHRVDAMGYGDYDSPVPGTEFGNDIGTIARALEEFMGSAGEREALARALDDQRESSQRALEETVTRVEAENAKLVEAAIEAQREDQDRERRAVAALAKQLEDQIAGMMSDAHAAAQLVDDSAATMSAMADTTQGHSRLAIDSADSIRTAVTNVAPRVAEVTQQLVALRDKSDRGRDVATQTLESVATVRDRMTVLKTAADEIDALQEVIAGIAAQTNMLALNAAIEAARDADAGSGFRVVAAEVKALAESSREATDQISDQIAGIRRASIGVEQAFRQVTEAMVALSASATDISRGIADQNRTVSAVEQAISGATSVVAAMNHSIAETDAAAQATSASSADMAAACAQVLQQITTLQDAIRAFTSGVEHAQAA